MAKKISLVAVLVGAFILAGAGCVSTGNVVQPLGMYRSPDRGETWTSVNALPTAQGVKSLAGVKVYRVYTDPSDPDALYVTTRGQGLFYTYNRGDSWQTVEGFAGKTIYGLAVDPKDKCNIYASDQEKHILKTEDCGRTWKMVYTDDRLYERVVSLAVDPGNSATIYAALYHGDIIVSNDRGNSWRTVKRSASTDTVVENLTVDPKMPGRVYVATYGKGLLRSDDGGATWLWLTEGFKPFNNGMQFYRLVLHPTEKDTIFWLCQYGVLRSNDAGKTWNEIKLITAPGSVNVYSLAVSPSNTKEMYYVATVWLDKATSRSSFYKTTDGGLTWRTKKLPSGAVPVTINVHPKDNGVIFLGFTSAEQ